MSAPKKTDNPGPEWFYDPKFVANGAAPQNMLRNEPSVSNVATMCEEMKALVLGKGNPDHRVPIKPISISMSCENAGFRAMRGYMQLSEGMMRPKRTFNFYHPKIGCEMDDFTLLEATPEYKIISKSSTANSIFYRVIAINVADVILDMLKRFCVVPPQLAKLSLSKVTLDKKTIDFLTSMLDNVEVEEINLQNCRAEVSSIEIDAFIRAMDVTKLTINLPPNVFSNESFLNAKEWIRDRRMEVLEFTDLEMETLVILTGEDILNSHIQHLTLRAHSNFDQQFFLDLLKYMHANPTMPSKTVIIFKNESNKQTILPDKAIEEGVIASARAIHSRTKPKSYSLVLHDRREVIFCPSKLTFEPVEALDAE